MKEMIQILVVCCTILLVTLVVMQLESKKYLRNGKKCTIFFKEDVILPGIKREKMPKAEISDHKIESYKRNREIIKEEIQNVLEEYGINKKQIIKYYTTLDVGAVMVVNESQCSSLLHSDSVFIHF